MSEASQEIAAGLCERLRRAYRQLDDVLFDECMQEVGDLLKSLDIANDAMCQASFFVRNNKSDLNYAIDIARKTIAKAQAAVSKATEST